MKRLRAPTESIMELELIKGNKGNMSTFSWVNIPLSTFSWVNIPLSTFSWVLSFVGVQIPLVRVFKFVYF